MLGCDCSDDDLDRLLEIDEEVKYENQQLPIVDLDTNNRFPNPSHKRTLSLDIEQCNYYYYLC